MITDNSKRIRWIKKGFYLGAVLFALVALAFFFLGEDVYCFISVGVLIVSFLTFQFIDFQYVYFEVDNGKIILKFFPVVKFGRKEYSNIEFPANTLVDYRFEKSVFGLVRDLILVVKTKSGVADYPSVSFAAVNKTERLKVDQALRALLFR